MSLSQDDAMMLAALQDFSRQLHLAFPLSNIGEFHDDDDEQLKEKILQLKENVSKDFFSKVYDRDKAEVFSLLMNLRARMNSEVIADWAAKNKKHKIESVYLLQKRAEMLCEDFQMELEEQLISNPHMEMDSFTNHVRRQKVLAFNYFDGLWKPRNGQIKEERKAKMEKLLNAIGEEVMEKHIIHVLERKSVDEGKKLVEEVKTILVEKSRLLKSYVDSHQGRVSKRYLKAEVEDMKEYLVNGKGSTLRESQNEIYSKVVVTFEEGIKFLADAEMGAEGNAKSPVDFIQWIDGFHLKLKSFCFNDTNEISQERNGCDSNDQLSWITIQKILREDPCGSCSQELPEGESRTHEAGGCGNTNMSGESDLEKREEIHIAEKTDSKEDDQPESLSAVNIRSRLLRSRPLTSSVLVKSHRLKKECRLSASHDIPLPKKQRTDSGNVSRKIIANDDGSIHWHRSNGNDKNHISALAKPSRRSSRLKKNLIEPDLTKDTSSIRINSTYEPSSSSSLHVHGEMQTVREDQSSVSVSTERNSQSNKGNTDTSESDSGESSPNLIACPDQITILGADPPLFKCNICKREFRKTGNWKFHGKFCWKARRKYNCSHCNKGFSFKDLLVNHIRSHTGEKPFKCPTCDKRFKQKCHMQAHIRSHTEKPRFICDKCKRGFRRRRNLNLHMLNHKGELPYACSYCDQRVASMAHLMEHIITHSDELPFNCVTCNKQFCLKHQLAKHIQVVHQQSKEDVDKQANDAALEYLRKVTKNPNYDGDISSTVVLKHAIRKAKLRIPDETDRTTSSAEATATPSRSNRLKLPVCLAQISNLGGDPPMYKCDVCEKEIQIKRILKFHGKNCRKKGRKCHHCGKQFLAMFHLVVHLRIHTGEKPFKCPTCNKQFSHKSSLQSHSRCHTQSENRRFPCGKCDSSFSHRSSLNRHMITHEGKPLFVCSYCDKHCSTMIRLKEHVVNHCDERPYKCPTCEKSFSCKQYLARHIQGHHQQPKEDAMRLANEAAVEYLRKENKAFVSTVSYSRIDSLVMSHVIKKANLKLCESTSDKF